MNFKFMQRNYFNLIFILCLTSCADDKLTPLPVDGTILAFGDSLTAGVGVSKPESYPSQLASLTGLTVINAGVSGEVTSEGLSRFESVIEKSKPNLVVLLEGGNDILRNQPIAKTKSNLKQMIQIAQDKYIPVLLIGVPKKNLFSDAAEIYAELANEHDLIYDGEIIAGLIRSSSMKSDSVHFNQKGYQQLAKRIHQMIVDNGGLD